MEQKVSSFMGPVWDTSYEMLSTYMYRAGFCSISGIADPLAFATGSLAGNVTNKIVNKASGYICAPNKKEERTELETALFFVLTIGTGIAQCYVNQKVGQVINPNYSMYGASWSYAKYHAAAAAAAFTAFAVYKTAEHFAFRFVAQEQLLEAKEISEIPRAVETVINS